MKVHKICFKISSSHFFDLRRPPITLTGFSFLYLDETSKVIFSNSLKWKKLDPRSLFGPKNLLRIGKKYVSNFYGSRFFIFQFFSKWQPFSGQIPDFSGFFYEKWLLFCEKTRKSKIRSHRNVKHIFFQF